MSAQFAPQVLPRLRLVSLSPEFSVVDLFPIQEGRQCLTTPLAEHETRQHPELLTDGSRVAVVAAGIAGEYRQVQVDEQGFVSVVFGAGEVSFGG